MAKSEAVRAVKDPPRCELSIPEKAKISADGFKQVGVNDNVLLLVIGTVTRMSENTDEWDRGKRMTVQIKKLRIQGPTKKTSIDDALKATAKTV